MVWIYGHYKYFYSFSAGIDFKRQNLSESDVYIRQILTSNVDPRDVRVKFKFFENDIHNMYSLNQEMCKSNKFNA